MKKSYKKYCLALDLKNDLKSIDQYKKCHKKLWPEIVDSIKKSGIKNMEIFNVSNRLFMILETNHDFDFDKKVQMDAINTAVQKWEKLMEQFQKALPGSKTGEKWRIMDRIFSLNEK